jgi:hypothetical protein
VLARPCTSEGAPRPEEGGACRSSIAPAAVCAGAPLVAAFAPVVAQPLISAASAPRSGALGHPPPIAQAAYRAAAKMYPEELIELRQGARIVEKSK